MGRAMYRWLIRSQSPLDIVVRLLTGRVRPVFFDFLPPRGPRWGHGRPFHPRLLALLGEQRDDIRAVLAQVREHAAVISPMRAALAAAHPGWDERSLPPTDEAALFAMLARFRPLRYLEIGSGYSTLWTRAAVGALGLNTRITSIDPAPRAEVDAACDVVIRTPAQDAPPALFAELEPDDILFVDGSHRLLPNSDVLALFTEILPSLTPGVIVHLHDIFLPEDYPPTWGPLYYSEQYVLAALLLLAGDRIEVLFPSTFATRDAETAPDVQRTLHALGSPPEAARRLGGSFWFRFTA